MTYNMAELIRNMEFKNLIGIIVMIAFLSSHIMLMFVPIPEPNKEAVYHMEGILDAVTTAIVFFYYGSSSGSKEKGEQLSKALKTEQEKP